MLAVLIMSWVEFPYKQQPDPFDHRACAEAEGGEARDDDEAVKQHSQVYVSGSWENTETKSSHKRAGRALINRRNPGHKLKATQMIPLYDTEHLQAPVTFQSLHSLMSTSFSRSIFIRPLWALLLKVICEPHSRGNLSSVFEYTFEVLLLYLSPFFSWHFLLLLHYNIPLSIYFLSLGISQSE